MLRVSPALPAYLAAALSFFNLLAIYWWLPESLPPRMRDRNPFWRCWLMLNPTHLTHINRYFPVITLVEVMRIPGVAVLLVQRLCYMLAFTLFETGHAHHMSARFDMGTAPRTLLCGLTAPGPRGAGYVLTFFAAFYAAVQVRDRAMHWDVLTPCRAAWPRA